MGISGVEIRDGGENKELRRKWISRFGGEFCGGGVSEGWIEGYEEFYLVGGRGFNRGGEEEEFGV